MAFTLEKLIANFLIHAEVLPAVLYALLMRGASLLLVQLNTGT